MSADGPSVYESQIPVVVVSQRKKHDKGLLNRCFQLASAVRQVREKIPRTGHTKSRSSGAIESMKGLLNTQFLAAQASPSVALPVAIIRVTFQLPRSISATWLLCMQET